VKKKIAIIVPQLLSEGGVPSVGLFFFEMLKDSDDFEPVLISVSGTFRDKDSVHLRKPLSWLKGVKMSQGIWRGARYSHFGTCFSELEFQHYKPKPQLTDLLKEVDLVQVVAGSPAWAWLLKDLDVPFVLQVASLVRLERESKIATSKGLFKVWYKIMTHLTGRIENRVGRLPAAVLVENTHMQSWFEARRDDKSTVHFIPPGVDTEKFSPAVEHLDIENYILSVGRFSDPRKNIRYLFKAYSILKSEMESLPRLFLIGSQPPDKKDFRYADSLGILDQVNYLPNVSTSELIKYYQGAQLFVLSSSEEGLGMVIMEAMACGLPVVSTDSGGPSTLIKDGIEGFLTPVGDVRLFADRVRQLLENKELRTAMGDKGRNRVKEHFAREVVSKKILDIYTDILNKR
jgi:glycosyltransferase involved in cell wall biosynthesis